MYVYRLEILDQLVRHGVLPTDRTPPELVHGFVSDLYRYELRVLRGRLLDQQFPKPEYYARVVAVRNRYRVIALKPHEWLE